MTSPRETPLTDAVVFPADNALQHYPFQRGADVVPVEFARSLESTLAELREYVGHKAWCPVLTWMHDYSWPAGKPKPGCTCDLSTILARLDGKEGA